MARRKQDESTKVMTEQVDIEELKSECLDLCSEILAELDREILPPRSENFTKNEELSLANQATVRPAANTILTMRLI